MTTTTICRHCGPLPEGEVHGEGCGQGEAARFVLRGPFRGFTVEAALRAEFAARAARPAWTLAVAA